MKTKLLKQLRQNYKIVYYEENDWQGYVVVNLKNKTHYYRDSYVSAVQYMLNTHFGEKSYSKLKSSQRNKKENKIKERLFNKFLQLKTIAP